MENSDKENVSLKSILVKYLRQWKLFLIVFILSFIPAFLYLTFYPRTYEFAASILLQEEKASSMSSAGFGDAAAGLMKSFGFGSGSATINIDDEMEILASQKLFRAMILQLGINVIYSEPFSLYKMYREAPLKLTADSATMANLKDEVRLTVSAAPGSIKVNVRTWLGGMNQTFTFASLPAKIKVDNDEFLLDFDHNGSQKNTFKLKIRVMPAGWMAETLSKNITIEDITSASNVLTLSCSDHVRQRGLDMLNTLITIYNDDNEVYKIAEADKSMVFVDQRIDEILTALHQVESDLEDFKKKNNITIIESDVLLYSELYKELITVITEEEVKAHQIEWLHAYVNDPENKDKSIPSVFSVDEGEKGIVAQYNKIIVEREKILTHSNSANYQAQTLSGQAAVLREGIVAMIANAREGVTKTLNDLKAQENGLKAKFQSIPEKERDYIRFVRDQEVLQGIYFLMLQKREETIIALGKRFDRARVIEPPYIKKKFLGPRKLYAGIGIIVLTLVIPVGYLFARSLIVSIKEEYNDASQIKP